MYAVATTVIPQQQVHKEQETHTSLMELEPRTIGSACNIIVIKLETQL